MRSAADEVQQRMPVRRPVWPALAAVLFSALVLGGCSSWFPTGSKEITLPEIPAQAKAQPAAAREHQRILAAYGGAYKNPALEARVKKIADRLAAASDRPELKYNITILNSAAINAFALPTGQLYVTRSLLALANDNSELASVLSHEMAHVIADHAAIRADQARHAAMVSNVVTDVLSDPTMGALALARSKFSLASFSQAQELEADAIGVGLAAKAGFDPYGASRFLTAMGRNAELKTGSNGPDPRATDFMSSHPATMDRIQNAQLNARQHVSPGAAERDHNAYLASLNGVIYGDDPADGFVRGHRFVHPRLGFTFTAPEGFALENTAQAVLGVKSGGAEAMRLDVVRIPAEQSLQDYLLSGWIEGIEAGSPEALTINGFPAATAAAKGDQWSFRLYAISFGTDVYRFIYAAKNKSAATDREFQKSIETFRRLTVAEMQSARPLRLKIVTVHPGDTLEGIAIRHMSHHDMPVERFRVLNGLNRNARLKPGEQVKVVVE
jgi:predicted Zn-dependent protease